jgi:hypothetical protein
MDCPITRAEGRRIGIDAKKMNRRDDLSGSVMQGDLVWRSILD